MPEATLVEELPKVSQQHPFLEYEEQAVISFAFDAPDTFAQAIQFLKPSHFKKEAHRFVYEIISRHFEQYDVIPTRKWALEVAERNLTVDVDFVPVLEAIKRESNPREFGAVQKSVIDWTKHKAYNQLLTKEAVEALMRKEYDTIDQMLEEARRITDIHNVGVDFFDAYPLCLEKSNVEMLPSGFPELDAVLNGGIERGRVLMWQAATNVGKSIFLVHNGRTCVERGFKVLHITLEMSETDVMARYIGAFSKEIINHRFEPETRAAIVNKLEKAKATWGNSLKVVFLDPDETTVDTIYQLLENLKRKAFKPDVVIIDYLELMRARRVHENKEEWQAQAKVATQVCGLAKKANVLLFTATQSNRDGFKESENEAKTPSMGQTAGSYNKNMPVDYVCGIAQSSDEHKEGLYRISVEKSRHGAKKMIIRARVNYNTMHMGPLDPIR